MDSLPPSVSRLYAPDSHLQPAASAALRTLMGNPSCRPGPVAGHLCGGPKNDLTAPARAVPRYGGLPSPRPALRTTRQ